MKKVFLGLCSIPLIAYLFWGVQYITGLVSADPNQSLYNELFKMQYGYFFCGQGEAESTAIVKKHILTGTAEQQVINSLKRNGFSVTTQKGDGKIQPYDMVQGTREGGGRVFYVLVDVNKGRVIDLKSWVWCRAL